MSPTMAPTFYPTYSPTSAPTITTVCEKYGRGQDQCLTINEGNCRWYWPNNSKKKSKALCRKKRCKGDCGCHEAGFCGFKCPKNCRDQKGCYWLKGFGCLKKDD